MNNSVGEYPDMDSVFASVFLFMVKANATVKVAQHDAAPLCEIRARLNGFDSAEEKLALILVNEC